jgi:hypothetical protein
MLLDCPELYFSVTRRRSAHQLSPEGKFRARAGVGSRVAGLNIEGGCRA